MLAGVGGQHRWRDPIRRIFGTGLSVRLRRGAPGGGRRGRLGGGGAAGRSCRATAALFGVSVASVVKWCQRWRATGSTAASKMGGWRPLLRKDEREWLLARIAEKPDLTLRAVMTELAGRGIPASYGAVWRFFA